MPLFFLSEITISRAAWKCANTLNSIMSILGQSPGIVFLFISIKFCISTNHWPLAFMSLNQPVDLSIKLNINAENMVGNLVYDVDNKSDPKNEVFISCASALLKGLENILAWCIFAELNAVDLGDYPESMPNFI